MRCPKCGAESDPAEKYCGNCGNPVGSGKALCDGCMGAFAPADLSDADGRKLCPLCFERHQRRTASPPAAPFPGVGAPPPGPPRGIYSPPPARPPGPVPTTSVLAIVSLIVAVVFPFGVPGLVLGILALLRIRASDGMLEGKGFAVAGTALSALSLACWTCMIFGAVAGSSRETAMRNLVDKAEQAEVIDQLRKIGAAEAQFAAQYDRYAGLDELETGGSLPGPLENGKYLFEVETTETGFRALATPVSGKGVHFFVDERNTVRFETDKPATAESPAWQGNAGGPSRVRTAPVRKSGG
jgi:hypothetical protein